MTGERTPRPPSASNPREIGAVILAAGRSRRMGREKALLPFGPSTAIERILAALAGAGVSRVVVVTRADLAPAIAAGRPAGAEIVVNPQPDGEMLDSIRLGARELASSLEAFFVWPVDHPAVAGTTIAALVAVADRRLAAIPTHGDRRGHPALVGMDLKEELLALPAGLGLRELWRSRAESVREIPVPDPGVVANVDTPEGYADALAMLGFA